MDLVAMILADENIDPAFKRAFERPAPALSNVKPESESVPETVAQCIDAMQKAA